MRNARYWVGLLLLSCALVAPAQDYPNRPVRLLVGFPPGGGGDLLGRVTAEQLTRKLGGSFVVVNMPGASATIASGAVAKAPADGYTLLFTTSPFTLSASLFKSIPYDPLKDFTPIARVADGPFALVVQSASQINSVQDLITAAKANPGSLNYGSGGNGSVSYLAVELFKTMAGVQIQHVPFTGLPAAIAAVIGGQVQLTLPDLPSAIGHVRAGRLKMLGVTSAKRIPTLPEVPTVSEAGLAGYQVALWYGLLAPAGLPKDVKDKLHSTLAGVFNAPEPALAERLTALGVLAAAPNTPEDFGEFLGSDLSFWKKLVDATGAAAK
jgi:tripartite-type tricarboxylate transporter receptor subunit TctC